jgi:hypothetical protein
MVGHVMCNTSEEGLAEGTAVPAADDDEVCGFLRGDAKKSDAGGSLAQYSAVSNAPLVQRCAPRVLDFVAEGVGHRSRGHDVGEARSTRKVRRQLKCVHSDDLGARAERQVGRPLERACGFG